MVFFIFGPLSLSLFGLGAFIFKLKLLASAHNIKHIQQTQNKDRGDREGGGR